MQQHLQHMIIGSIFQERDVRFRNNSSHNDKDIITPSVFQQFDNARNKIWALEGYALRNRLAGL